MIALPAAVILGVIGLIRDASKVLAFVVMAVAVFILWAQLATSFLSVCR